MKKAKRIQKHRDYNDKLYTLLTSEQKEEMSFVSGSISNAVGVLRDVK